MSNLAKTVKELRTREKVTKPAISQAKLAKLSGLSPAFIYKIEAGAFESISLRNARKLAAALNVDLMEFINMVNSD